MWLRYYISLNYQLRTRLDGHLVALLRMYGVNICWVRCSLSSVLMMNFKAGDVKCERYDGVC